MIEPISIVRGEMLIPKLNVDAYQTIYEVENYIRRICYTVFLITYGLEWDKHIPITIKQKAEKFFRSKQALPELKMELLWNCYYSDITWLLLQPELRKVFYDLTKVEWYKVKKLLKILEIERNEIAHSHPLRKSSIGTVQYIKDTMEKVLYNFNERMIYLDTEHTLENLSKYTALSDEEKKLTHMPLQVQQFYMKTKKMQGKRIEVVMIPLAYCYDVHIDSVTQLHSQGEKVYPDARQILLSLLTFADSLISIVLDIDSPNITLLFPGTVTKEYINSCLDKVVVTPGWWSTIPIPYQDPLYSCHPLIWLRETFYPLKKVL